MAIENGQKDKAGNIKLGENNQGKWNPPGGAITYKQVAFWLMVSGCVRAVIDNRWGNNQGYFQANGGNVERIPGENLDEAIELASEHCADDPDMTKACRIAAAEARATMWQLADAKPASQLVRLTDVMMDIVAGNISTGKAREILRAEGFPDDVVSKIMAPPQV